MNLKYGIFKIVEIGKGYYNHSIDKLEFLEDRSLWDNEIDAINFIPDETGKYVVLPIFIKKDKKDKYYGI
jgi:hypothetical protein